MLFHQCILLKWKTGAHIQTCSFNSVNTLTCLKLNASITNSLSKTLKLEGTENTMIIGL